MFHSSGGFVFVTRTLRLHRAQPAGSGARYGAGSGSGQWPGSSVALDVRHSPIAERDYGAVLCLRDPDEFQLELFYRENHP